MLSGFVNISNYIIEKARVQGMNFEMLLPFATIKFPFVSNTHHHQLPSDLMKVHLVGSEG